MKKNTASIHIVGLLILSSPLVFSAERQTTTATISGSGSNFEIVDGQIKYELEIAGSVGAFDETTGGMVSLNKGMTKIEVLEAASENNVTITKNTDDEWLVGGTIIIFVDDKLAKTRN